MNTTLESPSNADTYKPFEFTLAPATVVHWDCRQEGTASGAQGTILDLTPTGVESIGDDAGISHMELWEMPNGRRVHWKTTSQMSGAAKEFDVMFAIDDDGQQIPRFAKAGSGPDDMSCISDAITAHAVTLTAGWLGESGGVMAKHIADQKQWLNDNERVPTPDGFGSEPRVIAEQRRIQAEAAQRQAAALAATPAVQEAREIAYTPQRETTTTRKWFGAWALKGALTFGYLLPPTISL